ncbi:hypothetical protein B2G71_09660 [Novosphingobium sp. PC22D]|uniref:cupin domain-containing protein n=1 Tax=Novosphingobium sp. PC22D TaxID=1962403 RepID=UPI000BF03545|nr:cupin domain-containing protein [Novosphingobium sp. PC22D]PEQ13076.1 hypothetical protein B2G71_09660 [Novosphingobium sp. PC22D]
MSEQQPEIANLKPAYCELKAGQTCLWCACGRSATPPFCDGNSHVPTGIRPIRYRARTDEEVLFCECKQTATPPFCDGTHSNLKGGYTDAVEHTVGEPPAFVQPDAQGFAHLDGECYVVSPRLVPPSHATDRFRIRDLVTTGLGATHQSQFLIELDEGTSPALQADGDVVVWIASGPGTATVDGASIDLPQAGGLHILAGETFAFTGRNIVAYISVCPAVGQLRIVTDGPTQAADAGGERLGLIDEAARVAMGPRYFQVLMDDAQGLANSAQFIGHIPRSKAEMHRHLYEEALIIVSGEGTIWNQTRRARVGAGDVIFFPRKVLHSLECTCAEGMDVVGFIHPGTNPGINY